MIPFEYVRRDVRREGLLFQAARKRASEANRVRRALVRSEDVGVTRQETICS